MTTATARSLASPVLIFALTLAAVACTKDGARRHPRSDAHAVAEELRARSVPLEAVDAAASTDLTALDTLLAGVEVVLVGEPAHGSHEPLAMRNRIIRYLVERGGLTAVALETGLPESQAIARYVEGRAGAPPADSAATVARSFTWGFDSYVENVQLLRWLRDWNDDPAHVRKVSFYGYDLSLGGPAGSYPTAAAIEGALAWLSERDPEAGRARRAAFEQRLATLPERAAALDERARAALGSAIDSLAATIARTPAAPAPDGESQKAWAVRMSVVAQQSHAMLLAVPPTGGGGLPPGAWRAINARDSAMADNVQWVLEREGSGARVLAFAHDMHVKRVPTEGGVFAVLEQPSHAMGEYLARQLGDRMQVIAMTHGDSTPVSGTKGLASLDSALARVRRPPYLLTFSGRGIPGAVDSWRSQRWAMRINGDTYLSLPPAAAFDHLIVLDRLTPARTVAR